jgi:hypothetical protein
MADFYTLKGETVSDAAKLKLGLKSGQANFLPVRCGRFADVVMYDENRNRYEVRVYSIDVEKLYAKRANEAYKNERNV